MSFFSAIAGIKIRGIASIPSIEQTDFTAPNVPTDLTKGNITSDSAYIRWKAVTDNVLTTGYKIYSNGVLANTVPNNEGKVTGLTQGSYTITVSSFDAAGNESAQSAGLVVATPAAVADPTDAIIAAKGQLALDSTYIDLSGAGVRKENDTLYLTSWADRSPSGNNAVQTNLDLQMEILPEFKSVLPDGFDDVMLLEQNTTIDATTGGFSLYFCLDKFLSELNLIMAKRTTGDATGNIYFFRTGTAWQIRIENGTSSIILDGMVQADVIGNKIYEIHHNGAGSASLLVNGVVKSTVAAPNDSWTVGRLSSAYDGDYFEGLYKGIFIFNSVLTEGEKTTMRDALMLKYNV